MASVTPNPVYQQPPDSAGNTYTFTVRLTNESSVSTTLTKFTFGDPLGSTDLSSNIKDWFGTATIGGNRSISASNIVWAADPPVNVVFGFAGKDASGTTWSQQITVSFVARVMEKASLLLTTPATVQPNPSASSSCRWSQQFVLEEQGGYDIRLTAFSSDDADLSAQLQQIFGTTTIAPFGRLQGTLCWPSSAGAGTKNLVLSGTEVQSSGTSVTTAASTTLAASASSTVTPSVSPDTVNLTPGSTKSASATISLSFGSGTPQWTATVSPSNVTTNWLTISPASGTGAAQLKLTASSAGLSNGAYNATVLIQAANAAPQFISVPVSMVVGGSSSISIGGVTNGASFKTTFAPGMLMSVFGTGLAPQAQPAGSVPLPLSMQGVSVTVNGFTAPLYYVSPGQLNIQIPYETGAGPAILGVNNNGRVASFPFQVTPSAPGIFMDGAGNLVPYASGKRSQILLAFITGEGDVHPALITGKAPTTTDVTKLPAPSLSASLTVGGVSAPIAFIGIPDGLVGVSQINFTVPASAPLGPQPVVVTVGGVASAPVTLTVTQ